MTPPQPTFMGNLENKLANNFTGTLIKGLGTTAEENALSFNDPDTVARVFGSKGNIVASDFTKNWADSLNQVNDELARLKADNGSSDPSLKTPEDFARYDQQRQKLMATVEARRDALRAQNPANMHNRLGDMQDAVTRAPGAIEALRQRYGSTVADFAQDPIGESTQAAKAAVIAAQGVMEHPLASIGTVVGTLADPAAWLVPAGGAGTISQGISDLMKVTGRQTALGVSMVGLASTEVQKNQTGHVDYGQTVDDMFHAVAPMTGLAFIGAGLGFARGASEGPSPGMETPPPSGGGGEPNLSTPEGIAGHHEQTFKDILNPEGHTIPKSPEALALEKPPITKDQISEVAGNMAQKNDKSPVYPQGTAEKLKASEEEVFPERAVVPKTALDRVQGTRAADEDGKPLVLYRGQKIDAPGTGSFYTDNSEVANTYAEFQQPALDEINSRFPPNFPTTTPIGEEPVTMPKPGINPLTKKPYLLEQPILAPNVSKYVVDIQHPFVVDMGGQKWTGTGTHVDSGKPFSLGTFLPEDWFDENPGYDGVIVKNVYDSAYGNTTKSGTFEPGFSKPASTVVIPRDPSQAINFWNHKSRLEGGNITPGQAGVLGATAAGAAGGFALGGPYGAVAGGVAGMLSPIAAKGAVNLLRGLRTNVDPNAAEMAMDKFTQHMNEARYAPLQIASQFKKIVPPASSKRINIVQHYGEDALPDELTPEEKQVKNVIDGLYKTYGKAGERSGMIDELRLQYAARIFRPADHMSDDFKKNWFLKLTPGKARKYMDGAAGLAKAAEDGLVLKHQLAEDNLAEYVGVMQELLAKNKYVQQLLKDGPEEGLNWVMPKNQAPRYYKPMKASSMFGSIAKTVNRNLSPKWGELSGSQQITGIRWVSEHKGQDIQAYLKTLGPQLPVSNEYAVHPAAATIHNSIFDSVDSGTFWRGFDVANSHLKQAKLSFSLFHAKTLTQHHLNMQDYGMANPAGYKDIPSVASGKAPIFSQFLNNDPVIQHAIRLGLAVNPSEDWEGVNATTASQEFSKWLDQNLPPEYRIPGAAGAYGKLLDAEDAFKKLTFGRFMTGFKLMDAVALFNRERTRDQLRVTNDPTYRIRSDDEIMKGVVSLVNNVYGAQDYKRLVLESRSPAMKQLKAWMYSATGRKYMQRLALAPDWIISTSRSMSGALGMRGLSEAQLHAPYMLRSALYYLLAANIINYMGSGHSILDNKDPLTVEVGGGDTVLLDKAFTDPLKLYDVVNPAGMTQAWLSKGSPLMEEGLEQLANKQFLTPYGGAPPIVFKKDNPLQYWGKRAVHFGELAVPIPGQQFIEDPSLRPLGGMFGVPIYHHRRSSKDQGP